MKTTLFALLTLFSLSVPDLAIGSEGKTVETDNALSQRQ